MSARQFPWQELPGSEPAAQDQDRTALARQLIEQGEAMLALGREMLSHPEEEVFDKAAHRAPPASDHSVGLNGWVDLEACQMQARTLQRFTRHELGDALGLKGVQTTKWVAQLLDHRYIERIVDAETGATGYQYIRKLEDEDPLYQVKTWAQANAGTEFWVEQAADETGLPEEEVMAAVEQLVALGSLQTDRITAVGSLAKVDDLGTTVYRWAPTLPDSEARRLERQRLADLNRDTIAVHRAVQQRTAEPGKSRRAGNTNGKRHRNRQREYDKQTAAAAARDEVAARRATRK